MKSIAHVLLLKTRSGFATQQPVPHHNTETFKASAALTLELSYISAREQSRETRCLH